MKHRKTIRVRQVMRTTFQVVDGRTTVGNALRAMKPAGATALIVQKRHEDDEYGIVLLSDIAKQVIAADKSIDRVNVYEVMSKPVISVPPDMNIRYCARLFDRFGLSIAPVLENHEVIGMVDYDSIVLEGLVHFE